MEEVEEVEGSVRRLEERRSVLQVKGHSRSGVMITRAGGDSIPVRGGERHGGETEGCQDTTVGY